MSCRATAPPDMWLPHEGGSCRGGWYCGSLLVLATSVACEAAALPLVKLSVVTTNTNLSVCLCLSPGGGQGTKYCQEILWH